MGSWDCYCAICGGPMNSIGIRKKRVPEENERSTKATTNEPSLIPDSDGAYNLIEEDVGWVKDCRALCLDPDEPTPRKAFISDRVHYEDYGSMSSQPIDEHVEFKHFVCYGTEEDDEVPTIPFHWDCYQVLCLVLTGSDDLDRINKDVLYESMMTKSELYGPCLGLDYDEPGAKVRVHVNEQFWVSSPGEELFVTSPLPPLTVPEETRKMLEEMVRMPALDSKLSLKVKSDPFSRFPSIARDIMLSFLDHDSLMNLLLASWCLHSSTYGDNGFWKMRIKEHIPWFMEAGHIFQSHNAPEGAIKGLYLWAKTATLARPHIKKPFRAIVNRRRVWYVCEQIRELYLSGLKE